MDALYALFFAVGVTAWIYVQARRRMGRPSQALVVAGVVGAIAFLVFLTAFMMLVKK